MLQSVHLVIPIHTLYEVLRSLGYSNSSRSSRRYLSIYQTSLCNVQRATCNMQRQIRSLYWAPRLHGRRLGGTHPLAAPLGGTSVDWLPLRVRICRSIRQHSCCRGELVYISLLLLDVANRCSSTESCGCGAIRVTVGVPWFRSHFLVFRRHLEEVRARCIALPSVATHHEFLFCVTLSDSDPRRWCLGHRPHRQRL